MNYWFYLEPYSFIFQEDKKFVIYNTLNSTYIVCPDHLPVYEMMVRLNDATNGYCVLLGEHELMDSILKTFITEVQDSFSGDLVECFDKEKKPFLFKPALYLNSDIRRKQENDITFFGERIMQNLNEVTLYLSTSCELECEGCGKYHKQMVHCHNNQDDMLSIDDYLTMLNDLHLNGVNKVNFSGGNLLRNQIFLNMLPNLYDYKFKKVFYIEYKHLSPDYSELFAIPLSELVVLVHPDDVQKTLIQEMYAFREYHLRWDFIVSDDADIEKIEELDIPDFCRISIQPYYNGANPDFFREHVFYNLQDIIAEPLDRQTIFRRQVLNENFFGKLTVMPSGDVYSNLNFPVLGNLCQHSLKELVYKELSESKAWLRVRNEKPCKDCMNKCLCPSISNYEIVLNRENMCLEK